MGQGQIFVTQDNGITCLCRGWILGHGHLGGGARLALLGKFGGGGGSKWGGPLMRCPAFERSCSTLQISKRRNLIFESLKVVFGMS